MFLEVGDFGILDGQADYVGGVDVGLVNVFSVLAN